MPRQRKSREARRAEQCLVVVMCSLPRCTRTRSQFRDARGGGGAGAWPRAIGRLMQMRCAACARAITACISRVHHCFSSERKNSQTRPSSFVGNIGEQKLQNAHNKKQQKTLLDGRFLLGIYFHVPDDARSSAPPTPLQGHPPRLCLAQRKN